MNCASISLADVVDGRGEPPHFRPEDVHGDDRHENEKYTEGKGNRSGPAFRSSTQHRLRSRGLAGLFAAARNLYERRFVPDENNFDGLNGTSYTSRRKISTIFLVCIKKMDSR